MDKIGRDLIREATKVSYILNEGLILHRVGVICTSIFCLIQNENLIPYGGTVTSIHDRNNRNFCSYKVELPSV